MLLLLVGGTVVDRMSRRLVMLVSDSVCGVCVGAVAILIAAGRAGLWELAALTAAFGVASAFFRPASTAIMPDILPPGPLVSASSLSSLSQSLAQFLLGPLTGGIIVAVTGPAWGFGLDAASFAVSAGCLAVMHPVPRPGGAGHAGAEGDRRGAAVLPFPALAVVEHHRGRHRQPRVHRSAGHLPAAAGPAGLHAGPAALGVMYAASGAGGVLTSLYGAAARAAPQVA